jgi:hypothetical protein
MFMLASMLHDRPTPKAVRGASCCYDLSWLLLALVEPTRLSRAQVMTSRGTLYIKFDFKYKNRP